MKAIYLLLANNIMKFFTQLSQLLALLLICTSLSAQMKRVDLEEYGFNFSIELPKDGEIAHNFTDMEMASSELGGQHILSIKIRGVEGLSDLYIKATKFTFEELKDAKAQAYLAKYMTGIVQESNSEIIYEYKKDKKKYYQLCGVLQLNGQTYMYTSNDSYTSYSLKQIKVMGAIAKSMQFDEGISSRNR